MITVDDEQVEKKITDGVITLTSAWKDVSISLTDAADGSEAWQSGFHEYKCYRVYNGQTIGQLPVTHTNDLTTLNLASLNEGTHELRIHAYDKAGNSRVDTVSLKVDAQLSPVTFPTPCYRIQNGSYQLTWQPVITTLPELEITYYKAVIKKAGQGPCTEADWQASIPLTTTTFVLDNALIRQELVAYVKAVANNGSSSIGSIAFNLPPLNVAEGETYILSRDEYWSGIHELYGSVIVPEGITLFVLPGTRVHVYGNGNVSLLIRGSLQVKGDFFLTGISPPDTAVYFESPLAGETSSWVWQGIYVEGQAELTGCVIRHARRAITAVSGANLNLSGSLLEHNQVGVHVYGTGGIIRDTQVSHNTWYGIKEDAMAATDGVRPQVKGCLFNRNGYHYYHDQQKDIGMAELNLHAGNENNYTGE
jgi:hypothetical protein